MKIIKKILELGLFKENPPVLIDIGASGEIHPKWKSLAPYSICIAFDADDREFKITEQANSAYRKLYLINRIVTAEPVPAAPFHLTASPFCSSLLQPENEKLSPWLFSDLFKVEKVTELPAITVADALKKIDINYIDWFKTDTQGTDLVLFQKLPAELLRSILVAEFEPGIIDAYKGEDKLYQVMQTLDQNHFWLSSMEVKGTQRMHKNYVKEFGETAIPRLLRKSPGWAEVTYLKTTHAKTQRDTLLLFVFALIERQYGFALEVLDAAKESHPLFKECRDAVYAKLKGDKWKVPIIMAKRQLRKLIRNTND